MSIFTSPREKRFWFFSIIVVVAIFSTLVFGRPFQEMLRDQNTQAFFFVIGMALTGTTITVYGLNVRPAKSEIFIWIGLAAVYIMLIFRLGAPERSHLIEYSVLAIFIHRALMERSQHQKVLIQGIAAFTVTTLIGLTDELIQLFVPNRVFDPIDIFFNGMAAFIAIGGSLILHWAKMKYRARR